ncbi:hypothetical protein ABE65_010265 [Fictibacillus phosphorivorans]|uniref:Holin n=1 Tax=Fictibacillus phosphorivorans TaxID=1221500 RepID=A0A160ILR9_9BACL|nr:hypothetical protein [Fictibacillus phosphorivorans]ANC77163.1 hypothetical protein ABE65_010265 [Fictibacillus phosphorivorans]
MKNKFKSYPLWIAFFALIGLFVNDMGLLAPEKYTQYVNALLAILIAAGIVSNPSQSNGDKYD